MDILPYPIGWGVSDGFITFGLLERIRQDQSSALTESLQRPEDIADAFSRFGFWYSMMEENPSFTTAERQFKKSLAINEALGRYSAITRNLADLEALAEEIEAIADYTRVIELDGAPVYLVAAALFNRGLLREKDTNTKAEACADFARAARLYASIGMTDDQEDAEQQRQRLGCDD